MNLYHKFLLLPKVLKGKETYFKNNCRRKTIRLGKGLNAWTITPNQLNKNSVVYSFGIGKDISFDLAIIKNFNCTVHAFDPTPKSIEWVKQQHLPNNFFVHAVGLAAYNGKATFFPPENDSHISASIIKKSENKKGAYEVEVRSLGDLMHKHKHDHIDLLKMDIEGAEYDVIDNIIEQKINIKQLLIEFHHRFDGIGILKTIASVNKLRKAGYGLFHVSDIGEEFSFIRLG